MVVGTAMVLLTFLFHAGALVQIAKSLRRLESGGTFLTFRLFLFALLALLLVHVAEIWAWAALYALLGEFKTFEEALYFSAVTATTLGYGDLTLTSGWRLISTFEAMSGLLLFGVTTAFMLQFVKEVTRRPS